MRAFQIILRGIKVLFGIVCFGIGVAFVISAADAIAHPNPDFPVPLLGMFAAIFLLGSFLLLRRRAPRSSDWAEIDKRLSELRSIVNNLSEDAGKVDKRKGGEGGLG